MDSKEGAMNTFARRDKILADFQKESQGSFSIVYRALSEISNEKGTDVLKEEDVKDRIRKLINEIAQ
jgi:uncharacterized protein (DUF302 family)